MGATHEGGCLCGAVRYRVTGEPTVAQACHCRFCQQRTGSAFGVVAAFMEDQFELTGPPLSHYDHVSDESGRRIRIHFCSRCGVTVMMTLERNAAVRAIPAGTFDDTRWFKIRRHIWTRSAHDWMIFPPDIELREKG